MTPGNLPKAPYGPLTPALAWYRYIRAIGQGCAVSTLRCLLKDYYQIV